MITKIMIVLFASPLIFLSGFDLFGEESKKLFRHIVVSSQDTVSQDFEVFRGLLKEAVSKKNSRFLFSIIPRDIRFTFGPQDSWSDFLKEYDSLKATSKIWEILAKLLVMPAYETKNQVCIPAIECNNQWPDDLDSMDFGSVKIDKAVLRNKPDLKADSVAVLKKGLVVKRPPGDDSWYEIELADGTKGYLPRHALREATDYRAFFEKGSDQQWKLKSLVAGD